MPTISLFTQPPVADAFHQVTAPGGYEWWYFDAEDASSDLRIVAIFFQGFVFHPGYLRKYAKYARRPTHNAPPLPADYPCAYFVLYRGCEIVGQFMSQYSTGAFAAATDRVEVLLGENTLKSTADGSLKIHLQGTPWILTGTGPRMLKSQLLRADFTFIPRFEHKAMERRFFARSWSKADHHWIIADPLCSVAGLVELSDSSTGRSSTFSVAGCGYHDHNYGTGPIGTGLNRWMWGRALMGDHVIMFHCAQPCAADQADEIHMIEADSFGMRELAVDRFTADWGLRTNTLLRYPAWVEAGPLHLANPKILDASPFYLRLVYDVCVRGSQGLAFCEIAYPHRLRWPLLGRMIETSIRRE